MGWTKKQCMRRSTACTGGKMASFFVLLSFLLLSSASGSQKGLPEFAITSIDVEPVEGGPEDRVMFHSLIKGRKDDTEAYILRDIEKTDKFERKGLKKFPVFHATKIPQETLRRDVPSQGFLGLLGRKKVLLCIHGFNVSPESFLKLVAEKSEKFKETLVIPVIWPCEDRGVLGYIRDRKKSAPGAGKALASLIDCCKGMKKSIMCHSMGNFVLKNFAEDIAEHTESSDSKPRFENIFMVAADVRHDIFKHKGNEEKVPPVLCLAREKVYVLHSSKDKALRWGRRTQWANRFRKALGTDGCDMEKVSESCRPRIFNRNCNDFSRRIGIIAHNYQFEDEAIRIYEPPKLMEVL